MIKGRTCFAIKGLLFHMLATNFMPVFVCVNDRSMSLLLGQRRRQALLQPLPCKGIHGTVVKTNPPFLVRHPDRTNLLMTAGNY